MKRRGFIRGLLAGTAAVAAPPNTIAAPKAKRALPENPGYEDWWGTHPMPLSGEVVKLAEEGIEADNGSVSFWKNTSKTIVFRRRLPPGYS